MAKIVELIYTEEFRGRGVEGNPYRNVPQWWDLDGTLVFEKDGCESIKPRPAPSMGSCQGATGLRGNPCPQGTRGHAQI